MACCLSMGTILSNRGNNLHAPPASLSFLTGSRTKTSVSLSVNPKPPISSLCTAFIPSSLSFSSASSFSGSSLGLNLIFSTGITVPTRDDKHRSLIVRGAKYSLGQTKRNRSRKSLARTHGFRKRMSTTRGRAVLSRRRAKGRWVLCTKTNHNSGKHT